MSRDVLRQHTLMAHLLDALEAKQDTGHYGRLVHYNLFIMNNQGISSTKVYGDFLCQEVEQAHIYVVTRTF